ncbi:hypothetical protein [Halovenus halobia]|uniref:hypothetical protein n=1 Tax=Halovenus halobia TaxID=3396622 RepID=UPI003F5612AD
MTRIRTVGLVTVVAVVAAVVVTAGAGVVAGGHADDTATTPSVAQDTNETEVTAFVAESQGGYVAFSEDSESAAETEGVPFPSLEEGEEPIQIEATVNPEDGTWESENLTFPELTVNEDLGLTADVEVIDGLEGQIDREEGVFTVEGRFRVTIQSASFTYESVQTTGESGSLSGSAEFNGDTAEVTLVDNEFTVDEETSSSTINGFLDLPADEPGENWLVLNMDVSLNEQELQDRSTTDDGGEEEIQSTETLVLTVLGQAVGFAGLATAVLAILVTLVARVTGVISLE